MKPGDIVYYKASHRVRARACQLLGWYKGVYPIIKTEGHKFIVREEDLQHGGVKVR